MKLDDVRAFLGEHYANRVAHCRRYFPEPHISAAEMSLISAVNAKKSRTVSALKYLGNTSPCLVALTVEGYNTKKEAHKACEPCSARRGVALVEFSPFGGVAAARRSDTARALPASSRSAVH